MSSKVLKDLSNLINNCSHYFDINPIIETNSAKFFGKIKSGQRSEISHFIRTIYAHKSNLALEYLDYVEEHIDDKAVGGSCRYKIASLLFEQKDFSLAIQYLKQAVHIFEEVEDRDWLSKSYFALAKNNIKLENKEEAKEFAEKALIYIENKGHFQMDIQAFLSDLT